MTMHPDDVARIVELTELTADEWMLLLQKLHPGPGYSDDPAVCRLQGKISIHLEVARRRVRGGKT
jgi:hypothetical protein